MGLIEKYFGIKETKRLSDSKLSHRSKRYLAKLEEDQILKHVNELYVKGQTAQCFSLLERAVKLVPNDPRPFYLLGLIHEEDGRFEKASLSYITAAVLKKNDIALWKKALSSSLLTGDKHRQILALERIYRKEPMEEILLKKMEILKTMKRKYSMIACQIELFDYRGVDNRIFEKFETARHVNSLRKICSRLYKCIKTNVGAQTEYFVRKTIFNLYKIKDWKKITKLLDDIYFKSNDIMNPEIRFIYMTAAAQLEECRYDPLLDFDSLMEDVYVWSELEDDSYVFDLASHFRTTGDISKSIRLIEKLMILRKTSKVISQLGDYYRENGDIEIALNLYRQIVSENPTEEEAKLKLYSIYKEIGDEEMAKHFEVSTKVQEYIKSVEDSAKEGFRFGPDRCVQIKKHFESSYRVLESDPRSYADYVRPLVDDFFCNAFVIIKNKNFRSFSNKNEKICIEHTKQIVKFDESLSRKQMSEKLVRISSLHGLDVDEWFFVIKNSIYSLIYGDRIEEAIKLIENSFEAYIFRSPELIIQLFFLGIRVSLMTEDFEMITTIIRKMIYLYDYSAMYLLYALSYLFPCFHLNRSFGNLQKNIQRMVRKKCKSAYSSGEEDSKSSLHDREDIRDDITEFMGMCSFLPRFLQTDTVDFIKEYKKTEDAETSVMAGVIFITHTKSRVLVNKKEYATRGINFIKRIPSESIMKMYNLAKAYHFFGFYMHAENLYLKVIDQGSEELKRMSIFNLSLIFKVNKSRKVLAHLLSKV